MATLADAVAALREKSPYEVLVTNQYNDELLLEKLYASSSSAWIKEDGTLEESGIEELNKTTKSIKDAPDVLMERGMIPTFDTKPFSAIWCDFLYSQAVRHANQYFYGETEQLKSGKFIAYGNALIDSALTEKLPQAHM